MAEITYTLDLQNLNLENLSADQTLDTLLDVRLALARLKATDEDLLARLDELAAAGEIDQGGFKHAGWSFSHSDGRTSYDYPDRIRKLEGELKAAKEAAKANGDAIKIEGQNAFWTITPPPPNKP
jgi:hypothetical protein